MNDDAQLINDYLTSNNQSSFERLLDRYFDLTKKIVYKNCLNVDDRPDLVQQIWTKIIQALPNYKEEQKFPAFIATIAKNTIRDYWKYQNVRQSSSSFSDLDSEEHEFVPVDESVDVDQDIEQKHAIEYLMTKLIPDLPCDLRTVFLLRHESEYWDGKDRLDWNMIGLLTSQTANDAWSSFDQARKKLKKVYDGQKIEQELSCQELCTFLLWTQSQRPVENKKVTELELSELIGIPVNTFKTKYRAARNKLREALNSHYGVPG